MTPPHLWIETLSHGAEDGCLRPPSPQTLREATEALRRAACDATLDAATRARIISESSTALVRHVLDDPCTDRLRLTKEALHGAVDLILASPLTARALLNITCHDFYTYTHSVNVGVMSLLLAREALPQLDEARMREIGAGFFLHDIGKTHVDSAIIDKRGPLTAEEVLQVHMHPYQGYKILQDAGELSEECAIIVLQHHEHADGSGYPNALREEEIHPLGRVCAIADVFDALTAERSYKPSMTPAQALATMAETMRTHFSAPIFDRFTHLVTEFSPA